MTRCRDCGREGLPDLPCIYCEGDRRSSGAGTLVWFLVAFGTSALVFMLLDGDRLRGLDFWLADQSAFRWSMTVIWFVWILSHPLTAAGIQHIRRGRMVGIAHLLIGILLWIFFFPLPVFKAFAR